MPCIRPALFSLLLAVSGNAQAVGLGEMRTLSRIGEAFVAEIPLSLSTGETVDATCFQLLPGETADLPELVDARLSVDTRGSPRLRIEGRKAAHEPLLGIRIGVVCGASLRRDFIGMPLPPYNTAAAQTRRPAEQGVAGQAAPVARERQTAAPEPSAKPPRPAPRPRQDRLELGSANLNDSGLPPSLRDETEARLLRMETRLSQLNESLARLPQAPAPSGEEDPGLRLAGGLARTPPPGPLVTPVDLPVGENSARLWRQWLELLFGTLLGGVLSALAVQQLSLRMGKRR